MDKKRFDNIAKGLLSTTVLKPARFTKKRWKGLALTFGSAVFATGTLLTTPIGPDDDLSRFDEYITPIENIDANLHEEAWTEGYYHSAIMQLTPLMPDELPEHIQFIAKSSSESDNYSEGFIIIQDPQDSNECRMFESFYHVYDSNDGDTPNPDSTGYKVLACVEHVLPDNANNLSDPRQIARDLIDNPDKARSLTHRNERTVVQLYFNGWTMDPGGGVNAWDIEHGGLPIQFEQLLGTDGRTGLIEGLENAALTLDINLRVQTASQTPITFDIYGTSLGAPNAMLAHYVLQKEYPDIHGDVGWTNFVPMGLGQSARLLTEVIYNNRHNNGDYMTIEEIGSQGEEAREIATNILREVFGYDHMRTYYATGNQFAHFYVDGNTSVNNAPALPNMDFYSINPASEAPLWPHEDSYVGAILKTARDHFVHNIHDNLKQNGTAALTPANYDSINGDIEAFLFDPPQVERTLGQGLSARTLHFGQDVIVTLKWDSGDRDDFTVQELADELDQYDDFVPHRHDSTKRPVQRLNKLTQ